MKSSIIYTVLFTVGSSAFSQTKPNVVRTPSKVSEVKVFLSGAEETRKAQVQVAAGKNTIILENVTPFVDANSVQVTGTGAYTITAVSFRHNYLVDEDENPDQESLRRRLLDKTYQIAEKTAMKEIHEAELKLFTFNKVVRDEQKGLNVENVLDMSDLYQKRLPGIQKSILETELAIKKLTEEKKELEQQLREITEGLKQFNGEIVVKIEAQRAGKVDVEVRYVTTAAGWYPTYDVRSTDAKSPLDFAYKAMVYQSTGHPWENVKLTLATTDPQLTHNIPTMKSWVVYPTDPVKYQQVSRQAYSRQLQAQEFNHEQSKKKVANEKEYRAYETIQMDNMRSTADYTKLQSSGVNAEFAIEIPYSIPTDGKTYAVDVQKYTMPAVYRYFSVPKYDTDAFLLANIAQWEQYSLLSGNAYIYYRGTYVGESFLDAQVTSDTMALSLGRDKDIVIKRERNSDLCKVSTSGSNTREAVGLEITVRNGKNQPIELIISDQIPVSREKEIEVSLKENGKASHNPETGEMTWILKLEAGQTMKLNFLYEVKYPKGKRPVNL